MTNLPPAIILSIYSTTKELADCGKLFKIDSE